LRAFFKNLSVFFLIYICSWSIFNIVNANENRKGVCQADEGRSILNVSLDSYNELFYNIEKRKDKWGTTAEDEWYDGLYSTLNHWTGSLELCAGGNKAECQKIIEHTIYLSNQKKALFNWSGREDWDYIWVSTFWNNTSLNVVLYAYKIASEQVGVDATTNNQIKKWISKAVKSNKNLYLANVNKTFNNHQLQWLRANALYGLIWNDSKALKISHKGLKKFLKSINKNGVMKEEAIRGSRGLWYTGRAFHAIFSISELLNEAGIEVYDNKYKEKINKAVNFYIDASADNKLIYKWAKKKKNNDGNPKIQEQAHTGNSWVGAYLNIDDIVTKTTTSKLYNSETIQNYFFDALHKKDASFWAILDSECFYPVYKQGKF